MTASEIRQLAQQLEDAAMDSLILWRDRQHETEFLKDAANAFACAKAVWEALR